MVLALKATEKHKMPKPGMKEMLDAIAKVSGHVLESADKAVPTCQNCGAPIEQPEQSDPNQSERSEDK